MRLSRLYPDQDYDCAALQTAERARARILLESLAEARFEMRRGVDPALRERESALRRLLSGKTEHQMRLLSKKHTDERAGAATREIEELITRYRICRNHSSFRGAETLGVSTKRHVERNDDDNA